MEAAREVAQGCRDDEGNETEPGRSGDRGVAVKSDFDGRPSREVAGASVSAESEKLRPTLGIHATERPRVLIDNKCRILDKSALLHEQLCAPLPLQCDEDRIRIVGQNNVKLFENFIDNLGAETRRLLLTNGDGVDWVLVSGRALKSGDERSFLLDCALSRPLRSVEAAGLADDFGLTRTECAVLDKFALLQRPKHIGAQLGISVSTVRSHLKQIHTKLGVHSSVQLLQLTRAYCDS